MSEEYKYKKDTDWLQSDEEAYQRVAKILDDFHNLEQADEIANRVAEGFADYSAAWDLELEGLLDRMICHSIATKDKTMLVYAFGLKELDVCIKHNGQYYEEEWFVAEILKDAKLDAELVDFIESVYPGCGWSCSALLDRIGDASVDEGMKFIRENMVKIVGGKGSNRRNISHQCCRYGQMMMDSINQSTDDADIKNKVALIGEIYAVYQRGLVPSSEERSLADTRKVFIADLGNKMAMMNEPRVFRYMANKFANGIQNFAVEYMDYASSKSYSSGTSVTDVLKRSIESTKEEVDKRALVSKMKNHVFMERKSFGHMLAVMDAFDEGRTLLKDKWFIDVINAEQNEAKFQEFMMSVASGNPVRVERDQGLDFLSNFSSRIKQTPELLFEVASELIHDEGDVCLEHHVTKELLVATKEALSKQWDAVAEAKALQAKEGFLYSMKQSLEGLHVSNLPSQLNASQVKVIMDFGIDINAVYVDKVWDYGSIRSVPDDLDGKIQALKELLALDKEGIEAHCTSHWEVNEELERLYSIRDLIVPDEKEQAKLQVLRGELDYASANFETGLSVNEYGKDGRTLFLNCFNINDTPIEKPNINVIKSLIEAGADVNSLIMDIEDGVPINRTALHMIAVREYSENAGEIASVLLDAGANVNFQDVDGWTALHMAAMTGKRDVAKVLMEKGADISIKNSDGLTAKDIAIENNRQGTLEEIGLHEIKLEREHFDASILQVENKPKRKNKI